MTVVAQQESQFTQFMYNKLMINPSYAGSRGVSSAMGLYRRQWAGFEGAPTSQLISFDSPFLAQRVGIGATLFHRTIGVFSNYMGALSYSYALIDTKETSLRIGLQGSARYYQISLNDINGFVRQPNDPSVNTQQADSKLRGNMGLGVYFTHQEFYVGVSAPNMLKNEIGKKSTTTASTATEARHIYLMAGGLFPISDNIHLKPQALLKYAENAPISVDANLSAVFNLKLTVGASVRTGTSRTSDSVDLLAFYQLSRRFGFGAAYDFSLSKINSYTSGSFEVMMRYDLGELKRSGDSDLSNPRFFF